MRLLPINFVLCLLLSAFGSPFPFGMAVTAASAEETAPHAALQFSDSEVVSIYGADFKPFRDQTEVITRWDGRKSPYCITGFVRVRLTGESPLDPDKIREVRLHIKTGSKVAEEADHPLILGYTLEEFEPFRMTGETYDGESPWEQGDNAGIDPGQRKYPNRLAVLQGITEPETFYVFTSDELKDYVVSQIKRGKDAFFYLSQGSPAKRYRFVSFYGPSSASSPYLEIILE